MLLNEMVWYDYTPDLKKYHMHEPGYDVSEPDPEQVAMSRQPLDDTMDGIRDIFGEQPMTSRGGNWLK